MPASNPSLRPIASSDSAIIGTMPLDEALAKIARPKPGGRRSGERSAHAVLAGIAAAPALAAP